MGALARPHPERDGTERRRAHRARMRGDARTTSAQGDVMRRLALVLCWLTLIPVAQAAPPPAPDPAIAAIVAKVSAERLKADDARLVAFGTRNTFSEKMGAKRGVFA